MIRAALVGMGWWGRTLVEAVQTDSDQIRFVAGVTRTVSPEVKTFAEAQTLRLVDSYEALLTDQTVDAVVLAALRRSATIPRHGFDPRTTCRPTAWRRGRSAPS